MRNISFQSQQIINYNNHAMHHDNHRVARELGRIIWIIILLSWSKNASSQSTPQYDFLFNKSNTFILKDGHSEIGAPIVFFSNGYYAWSTMFGYAIIDSFYSHLTTDARWMNIGHWRYDSIREAIDLVGYGVFVKWGMRLSYFAVSYEIEIDAVNEILKIKLIEPYPDINLKYNYNLDFQEVYDYKPYNYPPIEQLNNNPEFLNRIDLKFIELQKKNK